MVSPTKEKSYCLNKKIFGKFIKNYFIKKPMDFRNFRNYSFKKMLIDFRISPLCFFRFVDLEASLIKENFHLLYS